eukprot:1805472-Alexandrium_andersonii.AAC.1
MGSAAARAAEALLRGGWQLRQDGALCSELGDAIAQRKVWTLATQGGEPVEAAFLRVEARPKASPLPTAACLSAAAKVPEDRWLEGELRLDPRIQATRSWQLSRPVGELRHEGGVDLVYDPGG